MIKHNKIPRTQLTQFDFICLFLVNSRHDVCKTYIIMLLICHICSIKKVDSTLKVTNTNVCRISYQGENRNKRKKGRLETKRPEKAKCAKYRDDAGIMSLLRHMTFSLSI